MWHMDGWHKLMKFKLVVHGGVDGCSRYIVYMTCCDNNQSSTVLKCFLKGAEEVGVIPGCMRSDKGGENVLVCKFMYMFWDGDESSFKTGTSQCNQRMERAWKDARELC